VSVPAPVRAAGWRPTWAEVELGRLRRNLAEFRRRSVPAKLLYVVKANAYGHGLVPVARLAEEAGADWLGVSSVEEGVAVREAGVRLPTLILGSLYPFDSFKEAAARGLTPTVASPEAARELMKRGAQEGYRLACHLKMDSGMGRIGMSKAALLQAVEALRPEGAVRAEGVYTHLSCADSDPERSKDQLAAFADAVAAAEAVHGRFAWRHAANSAAALRYPESRWDLVRPGLALYGLLPGFEPALSLKTRVVFVKNVPAGARIGYGASWKAKRPSRIATLPVGYADGYPRRLSNKAEVLLGGRRCPVAGMVSMDMLTVDATQLEQCHVGDEAVLLGRQGSEEVDAAELAERAGTIPYEIVTGISARVPRVHLP
jgi:alanine racemase